MKKIALSTIAVGVTALAVSLWFANWEPVAPQVAGSTASDASGLPGSKASAPGVMEEVTKLQATEEPAGNEHRAADGCSHCAAVAKRAAAAGGNGDSAVDEAAKRASMVVDGAWESEVFKGEIGAAVAFVLPDGKMFKGTVATTQFHGERLRVVSGTTTSPAEGSFLFIRNDTAGNAGPFSGFVRFAGSAEGYRLQANGPVAMPSLVACGIDEIMCYGYSAMPRANGVAAPRSVGYVAPAPIIKLESLPGALGVIYLDFDGERGPFPGWGADGKGEFDAEAPAVTDASVTAVWAAVAEDYAPFNLNVTTDLDVYLRAPVTSRIQCVLTPTTDAIPVQAGGVAFLESFNWNDLKKVCWSFYATGKPAAEVASHEVGHTLGLNHDGRTAPTEEYYEGQGSGAVGWAPIMGAGYYKDVVQWSKGEYANPSNTGEDDLFIIASNNNVDHRVDDHGATIEDATRVSLGLEGGLGTVNAKGVIETPEDIDGFVIRMGAGTMILEAKPAATSPNLDIKMEVRTAEGDLVATSNPDLALNSACTATLRGAGQYLVTIEGVGRGNAKVDGYTDYGSLGQYTLTGKVPPAGGVSDDHGNNFATATGVAIPDQIDGMKEYAGDVDTFTFTAPVAGIYTVISVGTLDLKASLYDSRYALLATDDDSAGNRNFRIRRQLSAGIYYIQTKSPSGVGTGAYKLEFSGTATSTTTSGGGVAVLGQTGSAIAANDVTPSSAEGSYYGYLLPSGSKTMTYTIRNSGTVNLRLTNTPLVRLSGMNPGQFKVTRMPAAIVAPGATTSFDVAYMPTIAGTHTATVSIGTSDPKRTLFAFSVQGRADPVVGAFADAAALTTSGPVQGSISVASEADVYKLTVSNNGNYVIETQGDIDTYGQLYNSTGTLLAQNDDGAGSKNFRIVKALSAGTYFVRVTGRSASVTGDYSLGVAVEVLYPEMDMTGLNGVALASGDTTPSLTEGTDFGSLNAAAGFLNRTFSIKNTGRSTLALSGLPLVTISGPGAGHFSLVQQPASSIAPAASTPVVLRFNPAFSGTHLATVSIASNDTDENRYTFAIKGVGTGLPDDHEAGFAGATILSLTDDMKGQLERGGDIDTFKFTVTRSGSYLIKSIGTTDTTGTFYDGSFRLLATDADSGDGANFQIPRALAAGTYYIQVRGYNATTTGAYVLRVTGP